MPSWWGKSSSKEVKKKASKESFIDTLHRRFKTPTESKTSGRSGGSRRRCSDTISELGSQSRAESRSPSPSKNHVARCQSFAERPHAQPLPLPGVHPGTVGRTDSGIGMSTKSKLEKGSKSLFLPLPKPGCIRSRANATDVDGDLATASVSSESSIDSDDPADSSHRSPQATDYDQGNRTTASNSSSVMLKDHSCTATQINSRESKKPANISIGNHTSPTSPKRRPLGSHVPNLQVPHHGAFCSAPDSSMSSPSRSPMRAFGTEQVINSAFWAGKPYTDVCLLGSGHCSSPGSGYNSGHNSMGGDMSGQLLWQQSRGSPECSPIPSPRMTSPGPSSRVQSGAVTPIHPRAGGATIESQASWPDDGKQQSHRLPLPPVSVSSSSPFSHSNSAAASPSVPRSPGRAENPISPGSRWKKGKLLGRGTFGHVYVGFNSESGEMCAMKEVTLFSDDAKSKESAKQLMQEIALLSRLRHPNIVQYYGSETVGDRLYIYLEYVSGGSIYKLLQEYGELGELAIRSYTQQILSGLAFLHSKSTVHRDIKGANILVDPNGRVKLADFGMAKHITGQSCPLSFKGSPYWMAPEVIKNSNGCNLAVDIWSLGCTVLEMATTKPPWSQFEGVAAMFKIGNSKDLPAIPDHLSDEGKDFVRQCLQRNPLHRPTAAQLLEHPFVKSAAPLERPISGIEPMEQAPVVTNGVKALGISQARNFTSSDSERLAVHSSRVLKTSPHASEIHIPRNISCPVSPIGSPLLHSRSPQRMSPSPISSPRTMSGSSTPLTGGSGAIPFNHLKQSVYLQEGFGSLPKPSNGIYINGLSYHDSNPDLFRGMQPGSHIFSELVPCENDVLGKQLGRPAYGELYDGQSVLADRVSQQLLRDHVKMNPSLDLSPRSSLPNRTTGL
ncbi:mitogen-activated protein kinase kinase kinase YODA [Ricinus communis]|uniref:mitogen-activated protein kinase kinase kinase YODA n=1 Tax=Ricinus communis TaxID=3988 RepID=UPI00201A70BF|nr:mitogen-activated protein kinase kinase kinase YODA [Ricinus communis]XP_048228541.1 mitogen-activated protein kinase kinase kinase YODA [Ricinus communis]XP_048228542.1 mitogen-activated protein kinase kinase kinase YODA [Ricinus communis]